MSSIYAPSATELASITQPDDGEVRTAGPINAPVEAVADGVTFHNAERKRRQSVSLAFMGSHVGFDWNVTNHSVVQTLNAAVYTCHFQISPAAYGLSLSDVLFSIVFVGAAHVAIPLVPQIDLLEVDDDGVMTVLATQAISAADFAAYNATKTIQITLGTAEPLISSNQYYLRLTGESGGNALQDSFTVISITLGFE